MKSAHKSIQPRSDALVLVLVSLRLRLSSVRFSSLQYGRVELRLMSPRRIAAELNKNSAQNVAIMGRDGEKLTLMTKASQVLGARGEAA